MNELIKDLDKDHIGLEVFVTPNENGVTPSFKQFIHDISNELSNY